MTQVSDLCSAVSSNPDKLRFADCEGFLLFVVADRVVLNCFFYHQCKFRSFCRRQDLICAFIADRDHSSPVERCLDVIPLFHAYPLMYRVKSCSVRSIYSFRFFVLCLCSLLSSRMSCLSRVPWCYKVPSLHLWLIVWLRAAGSCLSSSPSVLKPPAPLQALTIRCCTAHRS